MRAAALTYPPPYPRSPNTPLSPRPPPPPPRPMHVRAASKLSGNHARQKVPCRRRQPACSHLRYQVRAVSVCGGGREGSLGGEGWGGGGEAVWGREKGRADPIVEACVRSPPPPRSLHGSFYPPYVCAAEVARRGLCMRRMYYPPHRCPSCRATGCALRACERWALASD